MNTTADPAAEVEYPSSDGQPIADNTLQFQWIVTIQGNLDLLYRDDPAVFVAGDHLIYPVRGDRYTCQAPDVYVAFGRPKGHRPSYKVWEEGGVFPQVVFEVLSPGNGAEEMDRKRRFYDRHGAREYYVLDPDEPSVEFWVREPGGPLARVAGAGNFTSPLLGIRFERAADEVVVYGPSGERFRTFVEFGAEWEETARRAEEERLRAEEAERAAERERVRAVTADERAAEAWREADRERSAAAAAQQRAVEECERAAQADEQAEAARLRAVSARQESDRLRARLRELGVDPDAP